MQDDEQVIGGVSDIIQDRQRGIQNGHKASGVKQNMKYNVGSTQGSPIAGNQKHAQSSLLYLLRRHLLLLTPNGRYESLAAGVHDVTKSG